MNTIQAQNTSQNIRGYKNVSWSGKTSPCIIKNIKKIQKENELCSISVTPIHSFQYENRIFEFLNPIYLTIHFEDGWNSIDFSPLDIYVGGKTKEEALDEFYEEIYLAWKFYTTTDSEDITPGALKMKNYLLENIRVEDAI